MSTFEPEMFYALAQVAITITGFAGILIALVPYDRAGLDPFEQMNIWYVLAHGAAVVFLSFMPAILHAGSFAGDLVWATSFAAFAAYALAGTIVAFLCRSKLRRDKDSLEKWRSTLVGKAIFDFLPFGGVVTTGALGCAAIDLWLPRGQALFASLLLFLLAFSLLHFAYFLANTAGGGLREPKA